MGWLDLREPVSALSHGLGVALALPGMILLWRRTRPGRETRLSLLVYGLGLTLCYGCSATYHAVQGSPDRVAFYRLLDHIGIYLLIAGTYTPLASVLLEGPWRHGTLALAWGCAAGGAFLNVSFGVLPGWLSTVVYLGMGWGAVLCYVEVARRLTYRHLRPILLGGVFYSVGACLNLVGWPVIWPGVVQAHEVFHLFVMAGSLCHFWFMLRVVAPYSHGTIPDLIPTAPVGLRSWTAIVHPAALGQLPRPRTLLVRERRLRRPSEDATGKTPPVAPRV